MDSESARHGLPGRLLRLLGLLQSRREWSGHELAERLGVTDRTVRRDVDRLRALDYPVTGTTGSAGGYRLASGRDLPPLLLDDDEAVAVAMGLVTAAGSAIDGVEDPARRALVKLERMLPVRLRPRLTAVAASATAIPPTERPEALDPGVLAVLADGCRNNEILTFGYRNKSGELSTRRVEPHNLVAVRGHWYLVAFDPSRADWRIFRIDRVDEPHTTYRAFTPRQLPAADPATYVRRSFDSATYRHTALLTVALSEASVRARLLAPALGTIESRGENSCEVRISGDSADLVAQYVTAIAALGADITLDTDDAVTQRVRAAIGILGNRN